LGARIGVVAYGTTCSFANEASATRISGHPLSQRQQAAPPTSTAPLRPRCRQPLQPRASLPSASHAAAAHTPARFHCPTGVAPRRSPGASSSSEPALH